MLVVDDDKANVKLLQRVLQRQGHNVVAVNCAQEALRVIHEDEIQLVITDYLMPDMTGFELIASLQKLPERPRTIMVSGSVLPDHLHSSLQSWGIPFVPKPYEIGPFQLLVNQTLRGVN